MASTSEFPDPIDKLATSADVDSNFSQCVQSELKTIRHVLKGDGSYNEYVGNLLVDLKKLFKSSAFRGMSKEYVRQCLEVVTTFVSILRLQHTAIETRIRVFDTLVSIDPEAQYPVPIFDESAEICAKIEEEADKVEKYFVFLTLPENESLLPDYSDFFEVRSNALRAIAVFEQAFLAAGAVNSAVFAKLGQGELEVAATEYTLELAIKRREDKIVADAAKGATLRVLELFGEYHLDPPELMS